MQDFFRGFRDEVRTRFWPDRYFAWQTLLLLSLFSLFIAAVVESTGDNNPWAVTLLTNFSWIFLVSAVWWGFKEHPVKIYGFSISPWITGAVLCMFLFKPWTDTRFRWALTCWPTISTGVMALPYFVDWELKVKTPKKQDQKTLVMTLLVNLLLSSWIQFFFRVQDWVSNYPSLLVSSVGDSAFVYSFSQERDRQSQGVPLLETMIVDIEQELSGQPWYQTERWLYTRQPRLDAIAQQAKESLEAPTEGIYWQVDSPTELRPIEDGYFLDLTANWTGPTSRQGTFYVQKTCKILPVDVPRPVPTEPVPTETDDPQPTSRSTIVDCGEEPPVQQRREASAALSRRVSQSLYASAAAYDSDNL
ncbi:MAG: DUF5357 family protein [Cyanobacteria bacterium P01_D01_bin.1]